MSVPEKVDIAANLQRVRERMADAARRAGRNPEEITLVAITKTIEPATVIQAIALGLRDLGENRVQEAEWKVPLLPEVTWHMIGHLQRNKVKKALLIFDMIHSVDSLRLAQEIDRRASRIGARVPVLLEVNLSRGEGVDDHGSIGHSLRRGSTLLPTTASVARGTKREVPPGVLGRSLYGDDR